jgi:hypothetical protein
MSNYSFNNNFCQKIIIYLESWFQRRKLLEIDQPETRTVWPNSFRGEDFVNEAIDSEWNITTGLFGLRYEPGDITRQSNQRREH